jgi:hypothetical protein
MPCVPQYVRSGDPEGWARRARLLESLMEDGDRVLGHYGYASQGDRHGLRPTSVPAFSIRESLTFRIGGVLAQDGG